MMAGLSAQAIALSTAAQSLSERSLTMERAARQSLVLWRAILKDFYRYWMAAEDDLLATAQRIGKPLAPDHVAVIPLDADPRNVKALALAGSVAFEAKDYSAARSYWERLAAVVPADSEIARSVQGSIAEARQLEGGAPASPAPALAGAPAAPAAPPAQPAAPAAPTAQAAAARITGEVVLGPELAKQVGADRVEIYTGPYGGAFTPADLAREFARVLRVGGAVGLPDWAVPAGDQGYIGSCASWTPLQSR